MRLPDDLVLKGVSLKDQYFDLRGLSAYSALSVSTLRDHIRGKGLPVYQLGGKILIRKSEFDGWMAHFRLNKGKDIDAIVNGVMREIGSLSRESRRQTR
jgi:excisionase family DNA binding protein